MSHQSQENVVELEPLDKVGSVVEVLQRWLRENVGAGGDVWRQEVVRVLF